MTPDAAAAQLVVVADDDDDILSLVAITLRRTGFGVLCARDGEEALELVEERRPALVVLDVMMPKLSGLDVTRRIRALGNTVPIVLLTASVQERHREHGIEAGADAFVRKPFSPRELTERVERLLAAASAPRAG